jgi:hypothetical protein
MSVHDFSLFLFHPELFRMQARPYMPLPSFFLGSNRHDVVIPVA